MFVYPSRRMTQGAYVAGVAGILAFSACSDPELNTALRPDGAPEVLAVLVLNDVDDGLVETATFCKLDDDKRPALVGAPPGSGGPTSLQICSSDLSVGADEVVDAIPTTWYARIMFDELLNPDVEDLVPDPSDDGTFDGTMVNTQPATLKCNGVDVPYDGYYSPAGNLVTWPPGPSIVIFPVDHSVVPTGAECEVGLKSGAVLDKQGVGVPEDQLAAGYTFKIAPLTVAATVPVALKANKDGILPDPASNTPKAPLVVSFNTPVVAESLDVAKVTILQVDKCKDPTTTTPVVAKVVLDPKNKLAIDISDNAATDAWVPSTTYLVTFADSASITDLAGGTGVIKVAGTICFKTGAE